MLLILKNEEENEENLNKNNIKNFLFFIKYFILIFE
jgi:hypothetical protein